MSDCERVNFSESEFVTLSNYKAFKPYCVIYFLWRTVGRQTFFTPGTSDGIFCSNSRKFQAFGYRTDEHTNRHKVKVRISDVLTSYKRD